MSRRDLIALGLILLVTLAAGTTVWLALGEHAPWARAPDVGPRDLAPSLYHRASWPEGDAIVLTNPTSAPIALQAWTLRHGEAVPLYDGMAPPGGEAAWNVTLVRGLARVQVLAPGAPPDLEYAFIGEGTVLLGATIRDVQP